jgi:HD-like signal output (HDOD) protein
MDLLAAWIRRFRRARPDTNRVEPAGYPPLAREDAPIASAIKQAQRTRQSTAADPAGAEPGPGPAHRVSGPLDGNIDRRFTAFLFGVGSPVAAKAGAAERRVIVQIEQVVAHNRGPNLVPRLPVELPRLISLVRRDDVSPRDLSERLMRDPTLVGEVVRLANSPRYRTGRDIADLQEAVIALGQSGLTQLVVSAAMRPIFDARQGRFGRIAGTRVWDVTERCSHACVHLSGDAINPFHAYLAGMVANIGMIGALRVLDTDYSDHQPPRTEEFHDCLRQAAAKLSVQIARQWDFPSTVCRAVHQFGAGPPGTADDDLTRVLRTADRIAKCHVLSPGLAGAALAGLDDRERRCYAELERAFGR